MGPEEKARLEIDRKLTQAGWIIQDRKRLNLLAGLGVAVREFPTSTGEVDYALFDRHRGTIWALCGQHLQMCEDRVCDPLCL